jgi:hypothetical protein
VPKVFQAERDSIKKLFVPKSNGERDDRYSSGGGDVVGKIGPTVHDDSDPTHSSP